ncbi:hypothetical protein ACFSTA_02505 [Ornithinibacillus salinisoli]|uniref:Uncharacterized protein n=1 Tax=Ornithinibacillus salinisoli TaxID=1848459 RepID=A0ABW4VXE9_9BACI
MNFLNKIMIGLTAIILISVFFIGGLTVSANVEKSDDLSEKMDEWYEQGIDPNHTDVIMNINAYIEENMDAETFASLHIDRDQRDLGVIVVSLKEPIAEEDENNIEALLDEHAQVQFRQVDFTEDELVKKQQEIDLLELEKEGISVVHTSVDVISNRVEVGIDPYNEEDAAVIYEKFGDDMVSVVEGEQAFTLNGDDATKGEEVTDAEIVMETEEEEMNWFQKIIASISSWFKNLF